MKILQGDCEVCLFLRKLMYFVYFSGGVRCTKRCLYLDRNVIFLALILIIHTRCARKLGLVLDTLIFPALIHTCDVLSTSTSPLIDNFHIYRTKLPFWHNSAKQLFFTQNGKCLFIYFMNNLVAGAICANDFRVNVKLTVQILKVHCPISNPLIL